MHQDNIADLLDRPAVSFKARIFSLPCCRGHRQRQMLALDRGH